MLAEGLVEYWGQPLAVVVAETRDAALAGAAAVRPSIEALRPVLSVGEALEAESFLLPPMVLARGDARTVLAAAPRRLSGSFQAGGQEHFYLEGQIALAVPDEDGDLTIHSSTQHPTEVQHVAARILGCDQ
jgi:xanthine dehydrogenase large subunit